MRYASDMITVSRSVWERLDATHTDTATPIFVEVQVADATFVGRVVPAVPADELAPEQCRLPEWMWVALGAPAPNELWIQMHPCSLAMVGAITLRPRSSASLAALPDPVRTLSTEIAAAWASVTQGAELALACGIFDIQAITDTEGRPLRAGCILDTDVRLDLEPALDTTVTPMTGPTPVAAGPTPVAGPGPESSFIPATPADNRFIGTGYRLGRE